MDLSTDATAADAFAQAYQGKLIYCEKQWYRREEDVFELASEAEMQGVVKEFLQAEIQKIGFAPFSKSDVRSCLNRARINATLDLSRAQFNTKRTLMDCETEAVGCSDGHVLTLGSSLPDVGGRGIVTKKLGVAQAVDATCPSWTSFLRSIFNNDEDMIAFIRRAVGYSLTGSVREQCMFILIGTGANGKSTFLRTLQHLFGDYAASVPIQTLMVQRHPTHLTDLAHLFGKRFVTASEGEQGERLAEAKIKLMTGGDIISCRFMHKDLFEYEPQFKLWLATNNLPAINGADKAICRRIMVINFPVTFAAEQQDRSLPNRLLEELAGILNWALQGLNEWHEKGLNPPAAVTKSTAAYRDDNDTVGEWIKAACKLGPTERSTMKALYQNYSEWCQNSAIEPLSNTSFGKELSRRGYKSQKLRSGMARHGIAMRPEDSGSSSDNVFSQD